MYITYVIEGRRLKTNTKSNANRKDKNESEYSGLERTYDEYDRYEDILDADANEYLVTQDASIIRSETKITDTQGRNKTLVKTQQR
jgi:hypothetical protein